ncbi:amidohydrolase family protein [Mycobacterium sp. CVI_P3]|uniref:Amidohydrolase family protein n=1 Tax=Mycobacterium pinniadriaticum TaxID=2994102 RepID=A0ABT3S807_9MYCO|nr:amidohydrolase family protein [Mycobacterium pinniadriaticum]MCX2928840.1 amidohydrolase family protein [Mycobacterium pinniadriaticum]MCX2935293.1 amidohydrolase family protein [Mycobacterium pinniadriaticum]
MEPRIFDAHFHIIDPRFPLVPNNGYLPDAFTAADYRERVQPLPVTGGAVVSGSFQAFDQSYVKDALGQLGPGFVGVTQIPADTTDAEILALDRAGVRAVRFNLYRGGSATLDDIDTLARRVNDIAGWHCEFYLDAADLPGLEATLAALPQVSVDHLAMSDDISGALLRLVESGTVVKATGFGRIRVSDPDALMRSIVKANPGALIFGTDLPSTRAAIPFQDSDIERVADAVGAEHVDAVLASNARKLYRLTP